MSREELNNEVVTAEVNGEEREAECFGLMRITDTKLYAPSQALVNAEREILLAGTSFVKVRDKYQREQAKQIYEVAKAESYKDSYKSLSEYLTALQLPTLLNDKGEVTASKASQMRTAGSVYCDSNAPEALKALPWAVLGAMGAVLNKADYRKTLFEEVEHGTVAITTLAEAKEYVKRVTKPVNTANEADSADGTDSADRIDSADSADSANSKKLFTVTKNGKPVGVEFDGQTAHIGLTADEVREAVKAHSALPKVIVDGFAIIAYDSNAESASVYTAKPYNGAEYVALPPFDAVKRLREVSGMLDIGADMRALLDICDLIGYAQ